MSDRAHQRRVVEALLFAAAEPVSEESLFERCGGEADIAGVLSELAEFYAGRGVNLVRAAGGWAFRTAPDLAGLLVTERPVTRKLSRAAVETLAIVAYHQPVTRAEIEAIRGVAVAHGTLDRLLETGWVQPKGRRESPGRPVTWVTTPAFLAHFGLDSVKDLPGIEELRAAGLLEIAPAMLSENLSPVEGPEEDEREENERAEDGAEP